MTIKKILAFCMVFMLLPVLPASAKNYATFFEGFEGTNAWSVSWRKSGTNQADGITDKEAYTGTQSYKTETASTNTVTMSRSITAAKGSLIEFSAAYKAAATSGNGVKMRIKNATGNVLWDTDYIDVISSGGQWKTIEHSLHATGTTVNVELTFELIWHGVGTVYWDDANIKYYLIEDIPLDTPAPAGTDLMASRNGACDASGYWKTSPSSTSYVNRTSSFSKSGTAYAISPYTAQSAYIYQSITGLEIGATYEFRFWTLMTLPIRYLELKLEFYNSSGSQFDQAVFKPSCEVVGQWTEQSASFTVPDTTKSMSAFFRVYGAGGEAFYDEISLRKIQDATPVYFQTDEIYYYKELTEGKIKLPVNTSAYKNFDTWTADASIRDSKGNLVFSAEDVPFTSADVSIPFPLSKLDDPDEAYTVSCTVLDGGTVLKTFSEKIYRCFSRPTMMTEDGRFIKDGKPFYPVIAYRAQGRTGTAKARGVNVIQLETNYLLDPDKMKTKLDELYSDGLYALVNLYNNMKPAAHPDNYEAAKTAIQTFKNHPAVFGWYVMDEPIGNLGHGNYEDLMLESYKLVRENDPVHPVYAVEMFASYFETMSKYVDVLGIDNYPYKQSVALSYTQTGLAEARKHLAYKGKAVITVLQFFNRNEGGTAPSHDYFPSASEMRNMIYQSFLGDASGFGFYSFGYTVEGVPVYDTETGMMLQTFKNEEQSTLFDVFRDFSCKKDGNSTETGEWMRFDKGAKQYYVLRNKSASSVFAVTVDTGLTEYGARVIGSASNGTVQKGSGSSLTLSVPKSGAAVFEVKSTEVLLPENSLLFLKDNEITEAVTPGAYTAVYTGAESDAMLIVARYLKTDNILNLVDIDFGDKGGVSVTVPDDGNAYLLSAFVWAEGTMKPFLHKEIITERKN